MVIRVLEKRLRPEVIEYILNIKDITKFHFHALNSEYLLLHHVNSLQTYLRLRFDDKQNVIGMLIYLFDYRIVEDILNVANPSLQELLFFARYVQNPNTLYQRVSQFKKLNILEIWLDYDSNYLSDPEMFKNNVYFDFDCIRDMDLSYLGISLQPNNHMIKALAGLCINIPKNLKKLGLRF